MQVIIDSSFILNCVRKNVDFVKQFESQGLSILVPREVAQELQHLVHDIKTSTTEKESISAILKIFEDHKRFKKVSAGGGKLSDWLLKKDSEGFTVATLDKSIKHKISNKVVLNDDGTVKT